MEVLACPWLLHVELNNRNAGNQSKMRQTTTLTGTEQELWEAETERENCILFTKFSGKNVFGSLVTASMLLAFELGKDRRTQVLTGRARGLKGAVSMWVVPFTFFAAVAVPTLTKGPATGAIVPLLEEIR